MAFQRGDLLADRGLAYACLAPHGGKTAAFDQADKQAHRIESVHRYTYPFPNGIDGMS
jgi:hypothetical protein